mgnify:CR=1 FL=1
MTNLKRILKISFISLGVIAGLALLLVATLTITEYRPDDTEKLDITYAQNPSEDRGGSSKTLSAGTQLSILTWNIGYGCLGANADFFMDGGSSVYTADSDQVHDNMSSITSELTSLAPDVILLQEVDERSSRSHRIDETEIIKDDLSAYSSAYAYNYKTLFVPYPLPPIGQVAAGIMTLSSYPITKADRIQLPCPFTYPMRLCNLKRCLLVSRIPIEDSDRELVIVNLHLEAYDSGEGKAAQTRMLADILQEEADAGNYVVAGGDFNQTFADIDLSGYPLQSPELWAPGTIDASEFGTSFTCLTDPSAPTCRSLDQPYAGSDHSSFQYYVIDGFIVSSNVEVNNIHTLDLDFQNSDHNPIRLEITLK